jgi:hypothetical protein
MIKSIQIEVAKGGFILRFTDEWSESSEVHSALPQLQQRVTHLFDSLKPAASRDWEAELAQRGIHKNGIWGDVK